ncbi:hypothetical protein SAMN04487965_2071 [Microbulbifer donghaiensis]|uniref:Amino acid permease n=1 Tax=Microbulbifer donghaiensis TaxID=494016 RepID=A0A1M5B4V5_9GAMM|nr:hypothetical protein [Microbulbifer donghaiensis]SHF37470.1 hypothetical protein SAMN04487965_2071 [Microbulbifer donghaiensis]
MKRKATVRGGGNERALMKATSTPLASIFGSGFLVMVPILAGAVGVYAPLAMALVCGVAYCVGSVIRFNIRAAEPALAATPKESTLAFERCSDLALVLAYVISVCLYLHILSAFVLGSLHLDTDLNESALTTAVIVFIMFIGLTRGLAGLAALEGWALAITLLIIVLLIGGFALYDLHAWQSAKGLTFFQPQPHSVWETLTIVGGILIVVQGFETTRYLGDEFDAQTRIRASRLSQLISTGVYLVFITVALPLVHTLNGKYDDNSLIQLAAAASGLLVAPLVIAAAMSQFSAAVADTLAATGNLEEVTKRELKLKFGTVLVGCGAIALAWLADTLQIVALASRAFAFYYFLQCLVAISVSHSGVQRLFFGLVAAALAFITVFAVPAS